MRKSHPFLIICAYTLVCFLTPLAQAQEFKRFDELTAQGVSHYIFAKQGEATVQVLVLGSARPGIYELGVGVKLDQLLALTGGTPLVTNTGTETRVTVRLFRGEGSGQRDLVYEAPFERMLTEPGSYPTLQGGDVLTIETFNIQKTRFGWRDALTIATSLTTVIILIESIASGSPQ